MRLQVLVIAATCVSLVAGSMVTAAFLLRADQKDRLLSIASALCRGIALEAEELKADFATAALEHLAESAMEGTRLELLDRQGRLIEAQGRVSGRRDAGPRVAAPGECSSLTMTRKSGSSIVNRFCARACGNGYVIQVVTRDVLDRHDVRHAAAAFVIILPLAVLAGAAAGRIAIPRLLRPLRALRNAAARLEADQGLSLSVGATLEELATLERAFDSLLARLGRAIDREKRFAQEASHEMRTPLTVLRGRLEELARDLRDAPDSRAIVDEALGDVERLDRLIDALLHLARSETAEIPSSPVNLCDLAREVALRQAHADGRDSPRPEVVAPDEVLVRGSDVLLTRALANVVENARKYAGAGARIRIRVAAEGARAVLAVEDNGAGIPFDLRPFVFDRFSRGAASRTTVPGTGLGLAVSRAIVVRHGGGVRIGRAALGGEEVTISLPLLVPESTPLTGATK